MATSVDVHGDGRQEGGPHDKRQQVMKSPPFRLIEQWSPNAVAELRTILAAANAGTGLHTPPWIVELVRLGFR